MSRGLLVIAFLVGCSEGSDVEDSEGIPVLGSNSHELSAVSVQEVVTEDLFWPRDLEFHPNRDELWVVNRETDSITIVTDPHGSVDVVHAREPVSGNHFLAKPSALAFNAQGNFATSHEEHELTQGKRHARGLHGTHVVGWALLHVRWRS